MNSSSKTSKPSSQVITEGHSPSDKLKKAGSDVQVVDENGKSENEDEEANDSDTMKTRPAIFIEVVESA